jgi:peptidyl-prolyl cis-trans isomerase SurA
MMTRAKIALIAGLLVLGLAVSAQSGETIDRIVATVNGRPLLLSEWEDSLRMEAFLQGRPMNSFSEGDRKAALNRLVDRVLLLQQMQADYSPTEDEVASRVQEIRAQLKGGDTDGEWRKMLSQYGLTEGNLDSSIRTQLELMRYIDLRLRPTIRITRDDVDAYYSERLVPELKKAGVEPQPIEQLRPKIRELLVQQQMDGVLEDWLINLRSQSQVHITYEIPRQSGRLMPDGVRTEKPKTE